MNKRITKRRPTRSDVAARAGVSKTTVTYALADNYSIAIPEVTRQRVKDAARELGYRPNAVAQALVSGRTYTATIAFPAAIGPYYTQVLQEFERRTNQHGYHLIASTIGHAGFESITSDFWSLVSGPNDAVIIVDAHRLYAPYLEPILPIEKPVIAMGIHSWPEMDCVQVDLRRGAEMAMAHLLESNPKRLAMFASGPVEDIPEIIARARAGNDDPRYVAYCRAMDAAGRTPEIVSVPLANRRVRMDAFKEYVAANGCPDALMCFTDDMAICAHRALREMGKRLPQDVLIVGCDGSEECESVDPQITTIVQPVEAMCAAAWRIMEARLADPTLPLFQVVLTPELVVRGSSVR